MDSDIVGDLEKIFKALSDKNRLRIVNMLAAKSLCVCEINAVLPLSQSTVSGHLRVLKEAGLVADTKDGLWVEYRLNRKHPQAGVFLEFIEKAVAEDGSLLRERERALVIDRKVICRK